MNLSDGLRRMDDRAKVQISVRQPTLRLVQSHDLSRRKLARKGVRRTVS
jgi:hypothetical protein